MYQIFDSANTKNDHNKLDQIFYLQHCCVDVNAHFENFYAQYLLGWLNSDLVNDISVYIASASSEDSCESDLPEHWLIRVGLDHLCY